MSDPEKHKQAMQKLQAEQKVRAAKTEQAQSCSYACANW